MKVGIIESTITTSAPPRRGLTTLGAEVTTISRSPATKACMAGGPAPKKIGSPERPCLAKKPFSCATQSGVCDAVIAAQPTRIRSWAEVPAAPTKKTNATKTLARNFTILIRRGFASLQHSNRSLHDGIAVRVPRLGAQVGLNRPATEISFSLHSGFFHDPSRGDIVDIANRPDAINMLLLESPVHQSLNGFRHIAVAPVKPRQ